MPRDKAIVTLAVGDAYRASFEAHARPTWEPYCARHGYDLILLSEPIDPNWTAGRKSIHWQKLLIGLLPQLRTYSRLVWLDGDILINHRRAPCIVEATDPERIGVVDISDAFRAEDDLYNLHTRYLVLNALLARQCGARPDKVLITDGDLRHFYRRHGFPGNAGRFLNTGVLVFDPARHARLLAEIYAKYDRDFGDYENTPVSYELQMADAAAYLDVRFNTIWAQLAAEHYPFLFSDAVFRRNPDMLGLCANVAFHNTWFLHFAGGGRNPVIKAAFSMVRDTIENVPHLVFGELWEQRQRTILFARLERLSEALHQLGDEADDYRLLL